MLEGEAGVWNVEIGAVSVAAAETGAWGPPMRGSRILRVDEGLLITLVTEAGVRDGVKLIAGNVTFGLGVAGRAASDDICGEEGMEGMEACSIFNVLLGRLSGVFFSLTSPDTLNLIGDPFTASEEG